MLGTWRASGKCVQGKSRMQLIVHTPIGMPYRVASEMLLNPVWLHSGSDCSVSISAKHKYINKTFLSESPLILYNPFHWCNFDLRVDSEERILCFWRQWGKIFCPHVAFAFVKSPFKVWIVLTIWSLVLCVLYWQHRSGPAMRGKTFECLRNIQGVFVREPQSKWELKYQYENGGTYWGASF